MAWVLTRGLQTIRAEFNAAFPGRDRTTDGAVGDLAHQTGSSGHNPDRTGRAEYRDGDALDEVRAIDVDRDLVPGAPASEDWMMRCVQHIITGLRAGRYSPVPLRYIIYRGLIWHVNTGWASRIYTGSNKHNAHAHFSGAWTQAGDGWSGSLGLQEVRGAGEGQDVIVREGDSGEEVRYVQYLLAELGFPAGEIDGKYGPKMAAAVNGYRARNTTSGPAKLVTGWQLFHMQRALAAKHAGKDGAPGRPGANGAPGKDGAAGAPGRDGKDGVFTGALTITGGTLTAVTPGQEN